MADLMKQYRELNEKLFSMLRYYEDMTASLEQDLDDLHADFEDCDTRKCQAEAAFHQLAADSDRRCADLLAKAHRMDDTIEKQARRIHQMVSFIRTHREELEEALTPEDYEHAEGLFDLDQAIAYPED